MLGGVVFVVVNGRTGVREPATPTELYDLDRRRLLLLLLLLLNCVWCGCGCGIAPPRMVARATTVLLLLLPLNCLAAGGAVHRRLPTQTLLLDMVDQRAWQQ